MSNSPVREKMRITIIGAGPAGLFFAYLMKRSQPNAVVKVMEQNAPNVTFGFGVVFSARALAFLAEADTPAVSRLTARMQHWDEQHIVVDGEKIVIDASTYSAIERIALLDELQSLCGGVGVEIEYSHRAVNVADHLDCDLLVGADGANSIVRDSYSEAFGTEALNLANYYSWYGVEQPYPAHTLTFLQNAGGAFCGHHYRYTPTMSTFVAEVDAQTWVRSGMSAMDDDERCRFTSRVFADTLSGKPLISNRSYWKQWRLVKNSRWAHRNIVLIGDALRTAHPSIGSGTRLAMEDSIALWRALQADSHDIEGALKRYEHDRRPVRDKLNRAAELSIAWYEAMASKMTLSPYDFAYDYLMRTGIMTPDRLAKESPVFMERYLKTKNTNAA